MDTEVLDSDQAASITKTFGLAKNQPATDGGWGYASVEEEDAVGDIVRVEGTDVSAFHLPPDRYIKILAQHLKVLPDGSPPIIGRVEQFAKTMTPDGKPALAFQWSWAKDGKGEITPLAAKYKALHDGGYLDSFSVGSQVLARKSLKSGGNDYIKTRLTEISMVTVPCNVRSTVLRALEATLGDELDRSVVERSALDGLLAKVEDTYSLNKEMESRLLSALQKLGQTFEERLDVLESSIVASSPQPQMTSDPEGAELHRGVEALKNSIEETLKNLRR